MITRMGILGGTFDPIHYGHLAIAEEARAVLRLDRVLFIPAAQQPLKRGSHVATPEQRFEMVRLACASNDAFEVSRIELDRPGPSYTVDTLEALHRAGLGELYFILGGDALAELPRWYAAPRILELARIVAVARPDFPLDHQALAQDLPLLRERLIVLDGPRLAISSSDLRRRVAAGRPIRYQTPDEVIAYIAAHGLYR